MSEHRIFSDEIYAEAARKPAFAKLDQTTTLGESLSAATGIAEEKLNGHVLPHIAKPAVEMRATPLDAILHPAAAALQARAERRAQAERSTTLPRSGDIVVNPRPTTARRPA